MFQEDKEIEFTGRIADLSEDDRPREKAIKNDIRSLSNAELLAIILGGGMQGKSVMDLSREMLNKAHNSLYSLSCMRINEMCRTFTGVGPAKAVSLAAAFELGILDSHSYQSQPHHSCRVCESRRHFCHCGGY